MAVYNCLNCNKIMKVSKAYNLDNNTKVKCPKCETIFFLTNTIGQRKKLSYKKSEVIIDELNREEYKSPGEKDWSGMDVTIKVYDGTYENGDIFYERSEEKLKVPTKDKPNGEYFPLSDIVMIEKATEENIKVINENWDLSSAYSETTSGGSTWGAAFGILAIVGEIMFKGADVVFIVRLKNGMDILATTRTRYLDEIKEYLEKRVNNSK